MDDAIQVGLDYDTHSFTPQCYDNRNPKSNDFAFMPWLMERIASDFCVDLNHQFFSGFSSGGWGGQPVYLAFSSLLRGGGATHRSGPPEPPVGRPTPTALCHIID